MLRYSPEFKRSVVERYLLQKSKGAEFVQRELQISRASLFRWIKVYGPQTTGVVRRQTRPQDWSMAAKLRALLETRAMNDQEMGIYLRENGLYYAHLVEWKTEVLSEVKKNNRMNRIPSNESSLVKRIRELEREVKLKDKALREATALLALKKKAELIWAEPEEEKSQDQTESKSPPSSKKRKKKAAD